MRQVMLGTYLVWRDDETEADAHKIRAFNAPLAVERWAETVWADRNVVDGEVVLVRCKGPHGDTTKYRVRGEHKVNYYVDSVEDES